MDNDNKKTPEQETTENNIKIEIKGENAPKNMSNPNPQPTFQTTIPQQEKLPAAIKAETPSGPELKSETAVQAPNSTEQISTINGEKLFSSIGKRVRNKWSEKEDQKLAILVKKYDYKNWKSISQQLPGRSSVQCLHRWTKILQPGLVKGPWTAEEDQKLIEWVRKQGPTKWTLCAEIISGRSGKQCREHWNNSLNPEVKKGDWTSKEDLLIMHFYKKYEGSWKKMIPLFPGRTENSIKNRFFSQLRKIASSDDNVKDKKISAKIKLSTLLNYLDFATKVTKDRYIRDNNLKEEDIEEIYKKAEEDAKERERCKLLKKAIRPKKSLFEFEHFNDFQGNNTGPNLLDSIQKEIDVKNKESKQIQPINNLTTQIDKVQQNMIINNNITNNITNTININNIVRTQTLKPPKDVQVKPIPSFLEYIRPKTFPNPQIQTPPLLQNQNINIIPSFNSVPQPIYKQPNFSGNIVPNLAPTYIQPNPYLYQNNCCQPGFIMINNSPKNICLNSTITDDQHFDENFENFKKRVFSSIPGYSFFRDLAKKPSNIGPEPGCAFRENGTPPELIPKCKKTFTDLDNIKQTLEDRQKKFG